MRTHVDPLGAVLLRTGALTDEMLADVLDQQRHTLPVGSLCYILGHLDEVVLARALSRQYGMPSLVLDQSVISLDVLDGFSRDDAIRYSVLPVYEDDRRIFFASEDPRQMPDVLRELGFMRGKMPVLHVALQVTLARTLRACYSALARGDQYHYGPQANVADAGEFGTMMVVSDVEPSVDVRAGPAQRAVVADVSRELDSLDLLIDDPDDVTSIDLLSSPSDLLQTPSSRRGSTTMQHPAVGFDTAQQPTLPPRGSFGQTGTDVATMDPTLPVERFEPSSIDVLDLDDGEGFVYQAHHPGSQRVLIVDDDFATRHLLVKVLQPLGLITATASTGGEAIRQLKGNPPDVVIIDVMLPEIDGFQVCQAIKQSHKYRHIAVILMSAVIDSGRVTDDVLQRYEAEAYFEKPIDTDLIKHRIQALLRVPGPVAVAADDESFEAAMHLYKSGDIDGAIDALRAGLDVDPLSAKHHFVLANLLQKKSLLYEAIDEYEATIDLKPDYFPALTRLAYLYYKQGYAAKAIEMWRRSLPHCTDVNLRHNIEVFMRKLIADMHSRG